MESSEESSSELRLKRGRCGGVDINIFAGLDVIARTAARPKKSALDHDGATIHTILILIV
jgi:hypothetical protein